MGGVSPSSRLYSQSYPSIYSSGAVIGQDGGHNGERDREKVALEAERERQRSGIVDLEEACEDEEEEEDMDERRPYGNESAGESFCPAPSLNAPNLQRSDWSSVFASGVFSMDEDSLSRDCEPFFESDGEEESTDGKSRPRRVQPTLWRGIKPGRLLCSPHTQAL